MKTRVGFFALLLLGALLLRGPAPVLAQETGGECLDYSTYLHAVANVPHEARFLARQGDLVYLSSLQVVDVSFAGAPAVVGSFVGSQGAVRGMTATATHLYVITSAADGAGFNGLTIYDLANPVVPVAVGQLAVPPFMTQLRLVGDRAYLRNDQGLLLIADVSNPAAPQALGSVGMGWLDAFDLRGNVLYAVDNIRNDVVVIDVTDPASLVVNHRLPLAGVVGITFNGDHGYFLGAMDGTRVFAFTGPDQYTLVNTLPDLTRAMILHGDLAYTYGNPLQVYGLADPASPGLMVTVPFVVHAGVLEGDRALLGLSNSFVEMDLANTADLPGIVATRELESTLTDMMAVGTSLVTFSRMGLETYAAADCTAPVPTGSLPWQEEVTGRAVSGDYLYVMTADQYPGQSVLHVIDLSDMSAPTEVATKNLSGSLRGLTAVGDYLYTSEFGALILLNVVDPLDPGMYSRTDGMGFAAQVAVEGTDMVVADGTMLRHFDISASDGPTFTTAVNTGVAGLAVGLADGMAYFMHRGGVKVYAISAPGAENLVADLTVPGIVDGMALQDGTLYVEGSGIFMFDVSDPAATMFVGNLGYVADRAAHLTVMGDCLYFDQYLSGDRGRLNIVHRRCAAGGGGDDELQVMIDIMPGSDRNPINCRSWEGVIPVAILTTPDFDALSVDHTTVRFGPGEGMEKHSHRGKCDGEDRDDDGDDDGEDDDGEDDGDDDKGNNRGHGRGHDGDRGHGRGHGRDCDQDQVMARHEEDVDGDGDLDLVFHFAKRDAGIACGDTEAWLTGETFDGAAFTASDLVDTARGRDCDNDRRGDKALGTGPATMLLAPNPFNPATTVAFDLPASGRMRVEVYDLSGRRIAVVADEVFGAGANRVTWLGADESGRTAASGVYFVRITGPGVELNERAVLLK